MAIEAAELKDWLPQPNLQKNDFSSWQNVGREDTIQTETCRLFQTHKAETWKYMTAQGYMLYTDARIIYNNYYDY